MDWNWGSIIAQAVLTGIIVTLVQEVARAIHGRHHKGGDDE